MRKLIALHMPGGPEFTAQLVRAWEHGDAVLPIDCRLPEHGVTELLESLRPSALVDRHGVRQEIDRGIEVLEGDALVVATSGSSGRPKGVIHTHESVAASARATNEGVGVDPDRDRWLCCLPVAHVAGLSVVLRALLADVGCKVLAQFDADTVMRAARDGATLTTLVPTALAQIDAALFRRIVVGGSHPPKQLPDNCLVSYGLTETGSAVCYDGKPLRDVELELRDGEIALRGPMLFRAYRGLDPLGRDVRDEDGWFLTHDQGSIDEHGRLVVHGRRDDLIITGGQNVWPGAVEREILRHPSIAEAAVVGRPDHKWGQRVTAVVVLTTGASAPSLDELRELVRQKLAPYAAPHALEITDALPRTLLGKVSRAELTGSPPR